jgi:hypothetical protein
MKQNFMAASKDYGLKNLSVWENFSAAWLSPKKSAAMSECLKQATNDFFLICIPYKSFLLSISSIKCVLFNSCHVYYQFLAQTVPYYTQSRSKQPYQHALPRNYSFDSP